jgi:hypothetical protein
MPDLSAFELSNWENLSAAQRVKALQEIEDMMALKLGRQPRSVAPSSRIDDDLGAYYPSNSDFLFINHDLIGSDTDSYLAVETVIHEGRHAYQDDCITNKTTPLSEDAGKVSFWSHNMPERGGYYEDADYTIYRYQPIEADANDFARDVLVSFKSFLQHDPAYRQFCIDRELDDLKTSTDARSDFGEDYERKIAQRIEDQYKLLVSHQQKLSDISRDGFSLKASLSSRTPQDIDTSLSQGPKVISTR